MRRHHPIARKHKVLDRWLGSGTPTHKVLVCPVIIQRQADTQVHTPYLAQQRNTSSASQWELASKVGQRSPYSTLQHCWSCRLQTSSQTQAHAKQSFPARYAREQSDGDNVPSHVTSARSGITATVWTCQTVSMRHLPTQTSLGNASIADSPTSRQEFLTALPARIATAH